MFMAKKYMEGDLTQKVSNCAITILHNHPDLSKFHMKIKIESQKRYRVTLHGHYKGVDLCSVELGLDIWLTFKLAENKFLKQIKKAKQSRVSKIVKMRNKVDKFQGGNIDVNDASDFTI